MLSIACAQINPRVGDITGNAALVRQARSDATALGADLVLFSELVLVATGDVVLVLSNGAFGGLHQKLLDGLG